MTIIRRQIVHDRGRALHFRRIGDGPPVVLLHESPRSSLVLLPLATRIAEQFTVFALDTPGYGVSAPLPLARPSIADFADAVARSLRAAGLSRVPVYGTHTGATIAAELAARHPDLVSGVVLDGYPVFTRQERDLHETFYLPQFEPRWDGSHVVALWARVCDQFDYFPWYLRGESSRLTGPKPSLERHRATLHDFLRSGPAYAVAYSASFRFDALATLAAIRIPHHIVARESDLLRDHLDRLPVLATNCSVGLSPAASDAWAADIARLLRLVPGQVVVPSPLDPSIPAIDGSLLRIDDALFVRFYGETTSRPPLILLHETPGSAALLADDAMRLSADRLVIVPELPGHGISNPLPAGDHPLKYLVSLIERAVALCGAEKADIDGAGTGVCLARALADASPALHCVVQDSAASIDPVVVPLFPAQWDGSDLLAAWYQVRERELSSVRGGARGELVAGADLVRMHSIFVAHCLAVGEDRSLTEAILRSGKANEA